MELREIGRAFEIEGEFVSAAPHGSGHIHATYLAEYRLGGRALRFVHQRINTAIFGDPAAVMDNVRRVLSHVHRKLEDLEAADASRRALTLVPARDGAAFFRDAEGGWWRTYVFVEGSRTVDVVETPGQAYEAARAFGTFERMLIDLPPPRLRATLPGFHHTPGRLEAFRRALQADPLNRAASVRDAVAFAEERERLAWSLEDLAASGAVVERTVHNDTKVNNVLLDAATGEALCVIDLDTVMPGLALHDFGDLVRTAACRATEDEPDVSRVVVEPALFEALARGWLEALSGHVGAEERASLVLAGKVITFECGLRFLTGHLSGDRYFRTHRPGHNADRCRAQFALVRSLEVQEERLAGIVARL